MSLNPSPIESNAGDEWVASACGMCYLHCPIMVHRVGDTVVKIEGNPTSPGTQGRICPKGNAGIMRIYDPNRLTVPMKRTNPRKGPDEDPGWVEVGWDEVMTTLVQRLEAIRADNPDKLAVGGFHPDSFFWNWGFGFAFGTSNSMVPNMFSAMGHMCGPGPHLAGLMTHGSENTHPDMDYAEYVLIVGGGAAEAFQSAVPYGRLFGDARDRRCKIVVVDPQQSRMAAMADEWVPIRPATDGALLFAMMHTLVHELGVWDADYLNRYTNAGYLIGAQGKLLRSENGTPLVWDGVAGQAVPHDACDPAAVALEGSFDTPAGAGRPAFDLFKEQLRQYPPEWAAPITTVDAETIRRLARDMAAHVKLGATIEIDGTSYPHRPVSASGYRGVGAHSNGFHAAWAMEMINLLLGATRAVGGARAWHGDVVPGPDGTLSCQLVNTTVQMTYPPKSVSLHEYFPITCTNGLMHYDAQLHPEKYNVQPVEMLIMEFSNPVMTGQNPGLVIEGLRKIPFFVDITTYLDETAHYADLVLPDTIYLERLDIVGAAARSIWSVEDEGILLQQPVVAPPPGVRQSSNIYIELANALGILTGPMGLTAFASGIVGPVLDLDKRYRNTREYVDDLLAAAGEEEAALILRQGHNQQRVPPAKRYLPDALDGMRIPFYNLWLMNKADMLRDMVTRHNVFQETGLTESIFHEYAPMPFWYPSVVESEPPEYDLYAINWKTALSTAGAGTVPATNAWLMDVVERDPYVGRIMINRKTAEARGLADGERVCVESRHGELHGMLKLTETIHPEVLGTVGCFGHFAGHSAERGRGTGNFNVLLGSGYAYGSPSSLQAETTARVRIRKAGPDKMPAAH